MKSVLDWACRRDKHHDSDKGQGFLANENQLLTFHKHSTNLNATSVVFRDAFIIEI